MIIVINNNVFILITMRIWQWTIHVVAFVVHGFLVEIKFGVLFYWGEGWLENLEEKTEQGREATETHL